MYLPSVIDGSSLEALTASLRAELTRLAQQLGQPVEYQALKTLYAAPNRILEGMLVKADGTIWNPGSGAGIYARVGGAWVKL